jgi:hypothetical protein
MRRMGLKTYGNVTVGIMAITFGAYGIACGEVLFPREMNTVTVSEQAVGLSVEEMKAIIGGCGERCQSYGTCSRMRCPPELEYGDPCWTCTAGTLFFGWCVPGDGACIDYSEVAGCGKWVTGVCRGILPPYTCLGTGTPTEDDCDRYWCYDV